MRPRTRRVAMQYRPATTEVVLQPLGVVGIVSPWNFPAGLSLMPLATAIAAGNRTMVKPSEYTPRTSELMASMLREIFPEEQVAVVTGGSDVGSAFSALPFDHLVFTGSTDVGRAVMRAASENLVPVTLELGGKSPVIIDRGFSPTRAAKSIIYGNSATPARPASRPTTPWSMRAKSTPSSPRSTLRFAPLIRPVRGTRATERSSASGTRPIGGTDRGRSAEGR